MAHLTALPNASLPNTGVSTRAPNSVAHKDQFRVLAADSNSMNTQLLVEALARDAQFQMIEAPSNGASILQLAKREKPQIVVLSAKLGESGASFELVRDLRAQ